MDDYNLKLILKAELKIRMPSYLFNEIAKEIRTNDAHLSKDKLVELLFEKYSLEEMKNLILEKYSENESCKRNLERFLKKTNGLNIDERIELERKEKEKKKKKPLFSPSTDYGYDFYNRPDYSEFYGSWNHNGSDCYYDY
ncbi:MAG: hypothetical protein IKV87_01135 [Methanobrevibacter sp.]|nr:hypothetical protein [Methanobrevibacter sp.]